MYPGSSRTITMCSKSTRRAVVVASSGEGLALVPILRSLMGAL